MLDFYNKKKILITGHTGFKGAALSQILIMAGAEVVGYALDAPTDPSLYRLIGLEKSMNSIIGDIRDRDKLLSVYKKERPEIVFHLAAQPLVRDSYKEPAYTYEVNVLGTVNVLEAARLTGSTRSLLNVTTDKVYENKEWDRGYVETDFLDGYDPYSNSKSCSELVTHSYKKSFLDDIDCRTSTARAGNVIGGGDFALDRIIPDCVRAAKDKRDIIVRNPNSTRPYQHVLEPLSVYLMIAREQYENKKYMGYYNVGPDDCDCVTTGSLVDKFCREWGDNIGWINKSDGGPHEANFLRLDCTKLKNTFNWRPRYHIDEAIKKTVEWYKQYACGGDVTDITKRQIEEFFVEI